MRGKGSLILLLFVLSALPAAADPILSINPTPRTVNQGDTFSFDIFIQDAIDLYGFQFDLAFNPTLFSAISVTEGSFLDAAGTGLFLPGDIDNLLGTVSFVANSLLGPVPGVTGNGVLATMNFMALAAGTSPFSFANVLLLDSTLAESLYTTQSGSVTANGTTARVPEPSTLLFVGTGLALATLKRRRRAAVVRAELTGPQDLTA